jgi:hypothetical protein
MIVQILMALYANGQLLFFSHFCCSKTADSFCCHITLWPCCKKQKITFFPYISASRGKCVMTQVFFVAIAFISEVNSQTMHTQ